MKENPPTTGILLSGMRPTGLLHLGHYEGVLKNWVELQERYDSFYMVADWHSLTTNVKENASRLRENIFNMVLDWLAAGIDPSKCTLFIQSLVKQHAELHMLFSMIVPLGWLERVTTFKEQIRELDLKEESISYGLLGYPVLQAVDIVIYRATAVPIGKDQEPHLELAREIVRRFNSMFSEIFPEPQAIYTSNAKLLGIDNRKMSKSYGNAIALSEPLDSMKRKVMNMITDPARVRKNDPGHPEICNVFSFHKIYTSEEVEKISEECRKAKIGCVECKKRLSSSLESFLIPIQEKRAALAGSPDTVWDILYEGSRKASLRAEKNLEEVRKVTGLSFPHFL